MQRKTFPGNSGLSYVVQIISKLLDPKTSEFTATFVGRLVSILIARMGSQLGENLDLMLRAVLSKMQQAETLSVLQVSAFWDRLHSVASLMGYLALCMLHVVSVLG